jgi:hypothetical protein
MERSAGPTESRKTAGVMRCKDCGGDVFSVTNLEIRHQLHAIGVERLLADGQMCGPDTHSQQGSVGKDRDRHFRPGPSRHCSAVVHLHRLAV